MADRGPEGAALLVAGFAATSGPVLGQLGAALLATGSGWTIRRLSGAPGERHASTRASLKRHVDELLRGAAPAVVLAVTGTICQGPNGPALVTGPLHREYPEDATLPLAWLRDRLHASGAVRALVALSAVGDGDAGRWLEALRTGLGSHLIAVDDQAGAPVIEGLLDGILGAAVDARTGTVTPASLGAHLARAVPAAAIQRSDDDGTFALVPPLGELRLSRARTARAPAVEPASEELIGVVLPGRFRIERALARGSFGVVYRARQLSVERDVAVKVLAAGVDAASDDGRLFVQEIQSVGRIDHPNVVRIHQADVTPAGRLFFAMELLVGRDLQQVLDAEGPLEPARAVALTGQLLDGLGAVHAAGLVHADVKPANAFVVPGGSGERLVLIDFGLARLRRPGHAAESVGGTPAYMAPEQLHDGRVDARSDVFAAALVLVTMLTGWRRKRADEVVPPLEGIADERLRAALARALRLDPGERWASAAEFHAALAGRTAGAGEGASRSLPFRHLMPFTERDGARLFGRERDLATLIELVLYRRAILYTAPSGVGKTSLLRAGLLPRLEALGAHPVYLACRPGATGALATLVWPGATDLADAVAGWHRGRGGKLVLVLDQLEAALGDEEPGVIDEALGFHRFPPGADVCVVLSIREDYLARVVGRAQQLEEGVPIVRLAPLDLDGARAAILGPLAEQRLAVAPDLLAVLLGDLRDAARSLGAELGWGSGEAVYPPHLQLACSILCEALPAGETTLTLSAYRRLGGLDAIVGEHLDRVLDTELDEDSVAAARDLFLALVSAAHTRAFRAEAELLDVSGGHHGVERTRAVLELLRARGLVVRVRPGAGEPGWELVHDSLVPRVLAWLDRRDLARRRAVELVRYHLRRSRPEAPSLLGRAELRELREHGGAIAELDAEWARRGDPLTPAVLVHRSRAALRRRWWAGAGVAAAVLLLIVALAYRASVDRAERAREQSLRDRDLGRFALELRPFDWDARALTTKNVPAAELPELTWELYDPDEDDPTVPGLRIEGRRIVRQGSGGVYPLVETRGGDAFLEIRGRGRAGEVCAPSWVPLNRLPGYARRREALPTLRVSVPTCAASAADLVEVPAGVYIHGGLGTPPSLYKARFPALTVETQVDLPAFWIDRTEITNAAFGVLAGLGGIVNIAMPHYATAPGFLNAGLPDHPVAGITWFEARTFCRFWGKELPTNDQWEKAMRGGLVLADGTKNPAPRRNFPWGAPRTPSPANIDAGTAVGSASVGTFAGDVSPYGVLDLAGNIQEWTASRPPLTDVEAGFRVARGGNWDETKEDDLLDFMAIENQRPEGNRTFTLGARCVVREAARGRSPGR